MGHEPAVVQRLKANLPAEPLSQEQARLQDRVRMAVETESHLAAIEFCGARQDRKRLGRQAGAVLYTLKLAALIPRWERSPDRAYSFMDMATSTVYPRAVSRLTRITLSRPRLRFSERRLYGILELDGQ